MFPSVLSNGRVNDDSTATFVSKLKVTVENGQTAEFDSHCSHHGMPYLMVAKRNSNGTILRYRQAFDARIVNRYCELIQCNMPTFQDFRNLHQKR